MKIESSENLARRIATASEQAGLKPSTFCVRHFGNSRLYDRLSEGKPIQTDTYEKIIDLIGPPQTEVA